MFEIGIICIVVLAVGYWVTLWLMGRHDDVLHGDFVQSEQGAERAATSVFPAPPFPPKPNLRQTQEPATPPRADPSDTLQSLLASIKRDLKDAAQL